MTNYYAETLNAAKLCKAYQTGIERVVRYLDKEIEFVQSQLSKDDVILELGAGYGRIMKQLAASAKFIYGIDISEDSVAFGQAYLSDFSNCKLSVADVYQFDSGTEKYDSVLCLQNGLSAIKGDVKELIDLSLRILKNNGKAYFSSYSEKFWEVRLAWFQEQADKGLVGEIDYVKTGDGKIVCIDGFTASTFSAEDLKNLGMASGCNFIIQEIDDSSLFLIIRK